MPISRTPIPMLRPFVATVWASGRAAAGLVAQPMREHMLPSGAMHLVFRLNDAPLRIIAAQGDDTGQLVGSALVGGVHSRYYVREMAAPSCSVGAVLQPGAALPLFGVAADELAGQHTSLEDLWGKGARVVHERLLETSDPERQLAILEAELARRLPRVHCLHPTIAAVIERLPDLRSVEEAVRASQLSHRQFIARFRHALGLPPKTYLRIMRFQRVLRALRQDAAMPLASLAADAGYADQAHFSRDFLEFSGVTPASFRRLAPGEMNHLPVRAGDGPRTQSQISSRRRT